MTMPKPQPPPLPLRWIVCPPAQLLAPAWLIAARRAQWQVVLVEPAVVPREALPEWASHVRGQRLVAGLRVAVADLEATQLDDWNTLGPLLISLHGGDLPAWSRARQLLAAGHWPKLRFATPEAPVCLVSPFQPDVRLADAKPRWTDPMPSACAACAWQPTCPGPLPGVPPQPMPHALSNQFDLVETDDAPDVSIQFPHHIRHFRTSGLTPGILDRALAEGQIYLDRSEKARLDDFAADLALLVRRPDGVWTPSPVAPFAAEEATILAVLHDLAGVVVDIGAGPIRYLQELAAAQAAGRLTYIAVEPDLAALERTTAALPDAICLQGVGEALPLPAQSADAVLMLRSFNHLRDPDRAIREVARVLRPGGVFVACDNVTFGLCRSQAQLQRAHAIAVAQTPFEHYRNANVQELEAVIHDAVPGQLTTLHAAPVGPGTSNQWLFLAKRAK